MFYDTEIKVLDKNLMEVKTIMGDLQLFYKVIRFEDDIDVVIRNRVFCDRESCINSGSYFLIEGIRYKVIDIKKWSDYLEILIYECGG
ncbi:hypothetical protein [Dethiothermospora halolimnae]|uniref:hypothetical protein n=1 Tax=Dethiothermospora halolimnae TaxID=3114390 RepID=UPI003CCC22C7